MTDIPFYELVTDDILISYDASPLLLTCHDPDYKQYMGLRVDDEETPDIEYWLYALAPRDIIRGIVAKSRPLRDVFEYGTHIWVVMHNVTHDTHTFESITYPFVPENWLPIPGRTL